METILTQPAKIKSSSIHQGYVEFKNTQFISSSERRNIRIKMFINLLKYLLRKNTSFSLTFRIINQLYKLRNIYFQTQNLGKIIKANGRYFQYMYSPGFPSKAVDRFNKFEVNKLLKINTAETSLRFAFLSITRKCPLQCQHCFEWNNLNKPETFNYEHLQNVVLKLKNAGVLQIFLSGGEPMIRTREIEMLCKAFSDDIEFWVVTSGFNATFNNLARLKEAGLTGISVSIDHYIPGEHNQFRGSENAFDDAVAAVKFARSLNMPVTMNICVSRSFANHDDLYKYLIFAKSLDASFVQFLEPKMVGRYAHQDVLLNDEHKKVINDFVLHVNKAEQFSNYPIALYHGFYQQEIGCFAGGNRSLYIDSNGDVLSCPFCHNKAGNVLQDDFTFLINRIKGIGCPEYKIAAF